MLGFTALEVRTYLVLSLCSAIQVLVNQLEQPYARSLVVCDTPVNRTEGAEFSGSNRCGDRLLVIGEGAALWGRGDSLENIGRFFITLFVSGFADSRGRKAAAIVGWACILASTLLFMMAGYVQAWAKELFIAAQGLQGMSGIGLIGEVVASDIAHRLGDGVAVYSRRQMLGTVFGFFFMGGALYIQLIEITEFRFMWTVVNMLNVALLLLLIFVFPETQPDEFKSNTRSSVSDVVIDECKTYARMITTNKFVKYGVLELAVKGLADGVGSLAIPLTMAYFGFSQIGAMMLCVPPVIVAVVMGPLFPMLIGRLGHRRAYLVASCYDKVLSTLPLPFYGLMCTTLGLPWWTLIATWKGIMAGVGSLTSTLTLRIITPKENSKFSGIIQTTGFLVGSASAMLYSNVFDAQATNYLQRITPFLVSMAFAAATFVIFAVGTGPILMKECDQMTLEEQQEAAKVQDGQEVPDTAAQGDKKKD